LAKSFFEVLENNFHPIIMKYHVQFIVLSFTFVLIFVSFYQEKENKINLNC